MNNKRVTLKDIAKASGYSLISVHRAVHNKPGISSEVKQKILQHAERLGYTTNYLASALKRRQVNIAVVLPERDKTGKYYFRYIWKGVEAAMEQVSGYNINTMSYSYSGSRRRASEEQIEVLQELYNDETLCLDGLLTTPDSNSSKLQCLLSQFSGKGVDVVLIDNDFSDCGRLCCIAPNDAYTGRLSAELMNLALRQSEGSILLAEGDANSNSHQKNKEGFIEYFSQNNANIKIIGMEDTGDKEQNKKELLQRFQEDKSILGAYSVRARNTIPLCKAVLESGRAKELFVVGSDLFPESAEMLKQGVLQAIVYKNPYEKGYQAYLTLFNHLIKHEEPKSEAIMVANTIVLQNNLHYYEEYI